MLGGDEPDGNSVPSQNLEQAHAIGSARGASQRQHQRKWRGHVIRSMRANPNTTSDITPFIVKNAAFSRDRSPGRTR